MVTVRGLRSEVVHGNFEANAGITPSGQGGEENKDLGRSRDQHEGGDLKEGNLRRDRTCISEG